MLYRISGNYRGNELSVSRETATRLKCPEVIRVDYCCAKS